MISPVTSRLGMFTAVAILALINVAPVDAQTRSLTWTETTRMEAPGSLGLIMRISGGSRPVETRSAIHLQGRALIQEYDNSTFIVDLDAGRWTTIDHAAKTYVTMTFEEMARFSEQMIEQARTNMAAAEAETQASREELERSQQQAQAEIEFRISTESTGQRQRIGANNATQHFIIGEFEAKSVPEGVDESPGGSMYFLTELWQTADVPAENELLDAWARAAAADPQLREMAESMATAAGDAGAAMATALTAWDPNVGAGLADMAAAMEDITGTTVRSVVTVAVVPQGVTPDRTALVSREPATMGAVLGNAAAGAARQAGADAARGALRGISRGRLGNRGGDQEPEQAAPSVQPLFRMSTTRDDLAYRESDQDVLAALNARIAAYRQITIEELSSQPR